MNVSRLTDAKTDVAGAKTEVATQKADVVAKIGTAGVTAATTEIKTVSPDPKAAGSSKETTVAVTGAGGVKGTGASLAITGSTSQNGVASESKQGVTVKIQPTPTLAITGEQKGQLVTPLDGSPRVVTSQGATAELRPAPGTSFTGSWRTSVDGDKESSATEYGAQFGKEKDFLAFNGGIVNRSSMLGGIATLDSARATLKLRPAPGLLLTTNYAMNPEEKGVVTPLTRREYGLEAKSGSLELGGAYAATAFSDLTPEQLRKQAGAMEYGEYTLSVGLRFDANTRLTTTMKDSFYAGVAKGQRVYGLGFTSTTGETFLTLTGSMITNRAGDALLRNDYKAEAKLGIKF